ncbi:MAG: preprotein translocase subunit SecY [Cardiobacteriaceae bacterium]|nr:preprotein translocase subunit SecY [Cardiobacteriaceae bacterium]
MAQPASNPFKELTARLWFLIISLIIYRIGVHIPVPGVDLAKIRDMFEGGSGSLFQLFNMFSGGALSNASLLALGVAPYISASIIMQLVTHMYPALKELRQQGSSGQKKIMQYTRYLTLFVSVVQGLAISRAVMNGGMKLDTVAASQFVLITTIGLTTGAMFMMWLGEQITERGIGNGISMLIFAGISVNMPTGIGAMVSQAKDGSLSYGKFFLILGLIVGLFALIVYVERAQRKIAIHYAKRTQGASLAAMNDKQHIPLKINMAGVIPAIFASAIITLLVSGFGLFAGSTSTVGRFLSELGSSFGPGSWLYIASFTLLIVLFSFFYTSMMYENRELADNLKRSNAFIQGFRPGKQTAEYLDMVQERLTLLGAIYVAFVCILPSLMNIGSTAGQILFLFGGTSLLIAVVVAMDFMSQVQSHILSKQYESLMRKANLSGFGGQYHR